MDSTQRFSNRVRDYVRYRPSYPSAVIELLQTECGLEPGIPVADVGAGTGIFSRLLHGAGAQVFAVEPNAPMREAAEAELEGRPGYESLDGTAEATGLPDQSVAIVTCAQAFHWFANAASVAEFRRILRPDGWVLLVWNVRDELSTPFGAAYEALLRDYVPDYENVRHRDVSLESLRDLFGEEVRLSSFPFHQDLGREAFIGRVASSSYAPAPESEEFGAFQARLEALFDAHQVAGQVRWPYQTQCYLVRPGVTTS